MSEKNQGEQQYPYPPPPSYDQSFYPQQSQPQGQQQPLYYTPQSGVTQVITVITNGVYGPDPVTVICPSCREQVQTKLDYESSTKTHLMALVICLICWPCFWVPYVVDSCKYTNHHCSSCGAYLGQYRG